MKNWPRGQGIALAGFLTIAALVVGGLGWTTREALRLEQEQVTDRAQAEFDAKLRLAMLRLDSCVSSALIKEDSRPYNHFNAFFAPSTTFKTDGTPLPPGTVVEPSPLLTAELPEWMLLHFQANLEFGWGSPQVLEKPLIQILENPGLKPPNVTTRRDQLLSSMTGCAPRVLLDQVQQRSFSWAATDMGVEPTANPGNFNNFLGIGNGYPFQPNGNPGQNPGQYGNTQNGGYLNNPAQQQDEQLLYQQTISAQQVQGQQKELANKSLDNNRNNDKDFAYREARFKKEIQGRTQVEDLARALITSNYNGGNWFNRNSTRPVRSQLTTIHLSPMVGLWLTPPEQPERLVYARMVQIGEKTLCQGILLDWERLQQLLESEARGDPEGGDELFPQAKVMPMRAADPPNKDRTMTILPVELDPGPVETPAVPTFTPLRVGLGLAWLAALVALSAVGLGGWSLLSLAERRIRFVSAVTHELRTPLTTQRLYLDMLTSGMVKEEQQKTEYLETLHLETERLNRLVGNVLDFSRLERQRPKLEISSVAPSELFEQVRTNWDSRCQSAGKELVLADQLPADAKLRTDVKLVEQILGNLIDNACKYSHGAADPRIWLRARLDGKRTILEVEDRGPGVPPAERRTIFRAFRRGHGTETTGGVGLGLALAQRWATLVGGKLSVVNASEGTGACFRLELY